MSRKIEAAIVALALLAPVAALAQSGGSGSALGVPGPASGRGEPTGDTTPPRDFGSAPVVTPKAPNVPITTDPSAAQKQVITRGVCATPTC